MSFSWNDPKKDIYPTILRILKKNEFLSIAIKNMRIKVIRNRSTGKLSKIGGSNGWKTIKKKNVSLSNIGRKLKAQ